ncbi:MAG: STAS/SEC14 domain-containing protein [Bacteroidota bacterium]
MFRILDQTKDNLIALRIEGRIEKSDYEKLNPLLEKSAKEYDYINLYIEMDEIKGIQPKAMWDDIVTYAKYKNQINNVAVLSDKSWYKPVAKLTNPFVAGEIKYFPMSEQLNAMEWISQN